MRRASLRLTAATGLGLLAAAALYPADAAAAERAWQVGPFSRLEVSGPFEVTVRRGSAPAVRANGLADDLAELDVRVVDHTLRIATRPGVTTHLSAPVRFEIAAGALDSVSLAGSGSIDVDRVGGDGFRAALSGSGRINVQRSEAANVRLTNSGSGAIAAAGRCSQAEVTISGSGAVAADDLACRRLAANITGAGQLAATASEQAAITMIGSGRARIRGGAKCRVTRVGSGAVQCGG